MPATLCAERARVAARRRTLAQLLAMAAQQLVCPDRPGEVGGKLECRGARRRAIGPLIILTLRSVAESHQHTECVRCMPPSLMMSARAGRGVARIAAGFRPTARCNRLNT